MSKLLFKKRGIVSWGRNALLTRNFTEGALTWLLMKIKIFDDHIEFKEMWRTRSLRLSDLNFIEVRTPVTIWFSHHGNVDKFLSFTSFSEKDSKEIIRILRLLNIKVKYGQEVKLSP